jgi:hypothetical protein
LNLDACLVSSGAHIGPISDLIHSIRRASHAQVHDGYMKQYVLSDQTLGMAVRLPH